MEKLEVNLKEVESGQWALKLWMCHGQGSGFINWHRSQNTDTFEYDQALQRQLWVMPFHSNLTSHNYSRSCLWAQTIHALFMPINSISTNSNKYNQSFWFLVYLGMETLNNLPKSKSGCQQQKAIDYFVFQDSGGRTVDITGKNMHGFLLYKNLERPSKIICQKVFFNHKKFLIYASSILHFLRKHLHSEDFYSCCG